MLHDAPALLVLIAKSGFQLEIRSGTEQGESEGGAGSRRAVPVVVQVCNFLRLGQRPNPG